MCRPRGTRSRARQLALFSRSQMRGFAGRGLKLTHAFLVSQAIEGQDIARKRLAASGGKTVCRFVLVGI
jgi:hypothetical protein